MTLFLSANANGQAHDVFQPIILQQLNDCPMTYTGHSHTCIDINSLMHPGDLPLSQYHCTELLLLHHCLYDVVDVTGAVVML